MGFLNAAQSLLHPWLFMGSSLYYLPPTIFRLLRTRNWGTLFRWGRLRQAWFGTFWRWAGPQVRNTGEAVVVPLLQGRVRHGRVLEDASGGEKSDRKKMLPAVGGTVLEVGPGSGMWVSVFGELGTGLGSSGTGSGSSRRGSPSSKKRKSSSSSPLPITKIYGVEPNPAVHDSLRARVTAAGLNGVYEIVPAGIEDLTAVGRVAKGSVDCVVSVLCLCGIPAPEHNIRALYGYLKPGGRMYVYEHVCVTRSRAMKAYQWLINLFWPTFMGGCQLRRDTARFLREAGPWTSVDLAHPVDEPWYHTIPHIVGVLTK